VTKAAGDVQENITRIELDNGVNAGIYWRNLGEGMVPIFEEHLARLERGLSLGDWWKLESMERALIIAVRRIENAAKNHQTEAEVRAAKRKGKS
jgi:hypothetical protein